MNNESNQAAEAPTSRDDIYRSIGILGEGFVIVLCDLFDQLESTSQINAAKTVIDNLDAVESILRERVIEHNHDSRRDGSRRHVRSRNDNPINYPDSRNSRRGGTRR